MVRRMRWRTGAVLGVAVLVLGVVLWLVWPEPARQPRERHYRSVTACLLTDDQGLRGAVAAAAWAGMQEASVADLTRVQYLSVAGPQTAADALAYFNSLGLQKCAVIVAVGEAPVAAMSQGADRFPDARLVAVGDQVPAGTRLVVLPATPLGQVTSAVRSVLAELA